MYQGAVPDVPAYFGERGFPCPQNYNPADWIMNVAQSTTVPQLDQAGFFPQDERDMGEAFEPEDGKDALGITITGHRLSDGEQKEAPRPGFYTQTGMLFSREINNLHRDKAALGARFGLTIGLSLLMGTIFWDVGASDLSDRTNLNSSFGAMTTVMLMSMFGTAQPALLSFPEERPVFLREYSTNHYGVASYFASRMTMEFIVTAVQVTVSCVITYFCTGFNGNFAIFYLDAYVLAMTSTALGVLLGSSAEDPSTAIELLPGAIMPQILFSGFFTPPELIPDWLAWIRWICP